MPCTAAGVSLKNKSRSQPLDVIYFYVFDAKVNLCPARSA
jgi:hypothetical protein